MAEPTSFAEHLWTVAKGLWWLPLPFVIPKVILTFTRSWAKLRDQS